MATYHCSIKHGSKGNGASASAKADYVAREGKYGDKPDLEYSESGNMPEWASDPRTFWKASDENERANGRVFTEIEIALPREISEDERKELVQGFVKEHLAGHPYTVGIHTPKAALEGGEQPHAHIIFSERKLDGIERDQEQFFKRANTKKPEKGGCAKDRDWNDREKVQKIRESWERHYNDRAESLDQVVSCRSLKAQGIDREPEPHLGPKATKSPEAMRIIEHRAKLKKLRDIDREMKKLEKEIAAAEKVKVPVTVPQVQPIPVVIQEPVSPIKPFVPTAQSDSVTSLPEKVLSIQQPPVKETPLSVVVDPPAFTAVERAYHAVLRHVADIDAKIRAYVRNLDSGAITEERFNDLTDPMDKTLEKIIAPYPEIKLEKCCYDVPATPILVNGQPITELVKTLPPEPKPEPIPSPAKVIKR